jgi:hypothetical protein
MVKLTEVEDEHFTNDKPVPSKRDTLLASDDEEDDFTDTGMKRRPPQKPYQHSARQKEMAKKNRTSLTAPV